MSWPKARATRTKPPFEHEMCGDAQGERWIFA